VVRVAVGVVEARRYFLVLCFDILHIYRFTYSFAIGINTLGIFAYSVLFL